MTAAAARALATAFKKAGEVGLPLGYVVKILWPEAMDNFYNPFGGMWRRLVAFVASGRSYELRARRGGDPWRTLSVPLPDAVPESWERSEFTIGGEGGKRCEVRLFQAGGGEGDKKAFNCEEAQAMLIAQKLRGGWVDNPKADAVEAFLLQTFNKIPRQRLRGLLHKVWPGKIRRGPKSKRSAAK